MFGLKRENLWLIFLQQCEHNNNFSILNQYKNHGNTSEILIKLSRFLGEITIFSSDTPIENQRIEEIDRFVKSKPDF